MAASPFATIFLFTALLAFPTPSSSSIITLPLNHLHKNPSPDPVKALGQIVSISLIRAHSLKNPQSPNLSETPLFSHSYGAYSISLSFGNPPQQIPLLMDTGSDFTWLPCTTHYACKDCSLPSDSNPPNIPSFIPKLSFSSGVLGCLNPKCGWFHDPDADSRCRDCEVGSKNCTQICPPYIILYGSGSTGGIYLSDTLDFTKTVAYPGFIFGCSFFSSHQPAGIAGLGRGPASLPSQLGLNKFSYCLLSHKFDDTNKSSSLSFYSGSNPDSKTDNVSYTPFVRNPAITNSRAFSVYYYIGLRQITVGGKRVKIPYKYLSIASDGTGGTIIDSGTTFTFMTGQVFELVSSEFITQVTNYQRANGIELTTGLKPCYNVSGLETLSFPELRFHFKGGAEMVLPLQNYFSFVGESGVVCLTMVSEKGDGEESSAGPSIIIGNYQMQNFYAEYDLKNERFGFRRQQC